MKLSLNYWPSFVDIMSTLFILFMLLFLVYFVIIGRGIRDIELLHNMIDEEELTNVYVDKGRLIIESDVLFNTGASKLRKEGIEQLLLIGDNLKNFLLNKTRINKFTIIIEGHTDTAGSYALNDTLSYKRAKSVANLWENVLGFSIKNNSQLDIVPVGFGEYRQKKITSDGIHCQDNRRIEIRIVPKFDAILEEIIK